MNNRSDSYIRAAIENEAAIVANAQSSTRNHALNRSAFKLGMIPGITTDTAVSALMRGAGSNGYLKEHGEKATRQVIESGFRNGQCNPRFRPGAGPASPQRVWPSQAPSEVTPISPSSPADPIFPMRTVPDAKGKPAFYPWGVEGPPVRSDEKRRHVYRDNAIPVRIKVMNHNGGATNWYRVQNGGSCSGWQARKPDNFCEVPYLGDSDPFDREVVAEDLYWPEGEKDADAVIHLGALAITFGGTGDGLPTGCERYFVDRNVIIPADNDEGGRKHAEQKAALIYPVARSIRIVHFPELPEKGDVSDWIAVGKDRHDLQKRADDTPKWIPPLAACKTPTVLGTWKSSVVTAEVLRTKQFPVPQIILPGLICEGVTILASKPKVGKSWLALDVCLATAANRFTLGSLRPKTGDVLYLALEDSQRRLQRRVDRLLSAVSEAWPARLTMATEWRRVDEGGLDDIREWCDSVAEPKLIAIDTLAKIRSAKGSHKAAYDVDYEAIAGLHKIANERGIAILIIHHTRKMEADDAFDTVSGTLGLTGAADTILVLDKRAGAVTLHARGRDIEESETALQFNKETCRWTILGAAREVHRSNERSRIIEALTGASDGLRVTEIKALAEFSRRGAVDVLLSKMVRAGEIERSGRGLYRLPSSQSSDAGKIGEKERSPSQSTDLIEENSNLTNLTNLTGDLSCQPATMGQKCPPRFKDANEVDDAREL
jgi:hypothetical protein